LNISLKLFSLSTGSDALALNFVAITLQKQGESMSNIEAKPFIKTFLELAEAEARRHYAKFYGESMLPYINSSKVQAHHWVRITNTMHSLMTAALSGALLALREEAVIEAVRRGDCSEAHAAELLDISVEQFNDLRCFSDIRPAGGDL
jgi:hypothetical protein